MTSQNAQIADLKVFNNELYAAGNFWLAGGIPDTAISKWDGTNWCSLGVTGNVFGDALAVYQNELDPTTCTRTITIGYYGNFTRTFLDEIVIPGGSLKVSTIITKSWGQYQYDWLFI